MTTERRPAHNGSEPLLARLDSVAWKRISTIAEQAMELPAGEVRAFLQRACGDDRDLYTAVERLIAADHAASGFLERPILESAYTIGEQWRNESGRESAVAFAAGDQLAGRYRIAQLLGRGGMSEVYEAWDEELSISVALKTLRLPIVSREDAVKQLKRESLLTRSISHANVCRVYDMGRHGEGDGALWFLTMEVLRGETLAERFRRQVRFSPDSALPLVKQMAAGLGAAHLAGVIHRDFKPGNVILVRGDFGEQAVVTDFGISRVAEERAAGTALRVEDEQELQAGTPAYMAPEQVRGERVGPAADIYAFGIVLYEMVTGERPFAGGSAMEIAKRRLTEDALSPRSVMPELDELWEAVILRCLARDPKRRFGRAEDVAAALTGRAPAEEIETLGTGGRGWHTLPVERDAFIGRNIDIEELERSIDDTSRLVTLLGPGGMGKTRLAVRYGWMNLGKWPGGVWFCDLTSARSVDAIAVAVAGSMGVALEQDPIEDLSHAFARRGRCLVILDNFEQIVEHAAATVGRWLAMTTEACFLVTSRARLGLGDCEKIQAVEPLSSEQALDLFMERARRLRPNLELMGSEAEAAREVVRLLEGMPLAIELAAARMRVMSASQMLGQIHRRFHLLTGGPGVRHETLNAVIDGSWELLRPWEKAILAQCSVFEGGFTLEAAEVVVDLEEWPEAPSVVDIAQSLMDKSLLRTWAPRTDGAGGIHAPRLTMYASVQEYARAKLLDSNHDRHTRRRHLEFYLAFTSKIWAALRGATRRDLLEEKSLHERAGAEHDNVLVAHEFCQTSRDAESDLWLAVHMTDHWLRGNLPIGRRVLAEALALDSQLNAGPGTLVQVNGTHTTARTEALNDAGMLSYHSGDGPMAKHLWEEALSIRRQLHLSVEALLHNVGNIAVQEGDFTKAVKLFEEALEINRKQGNWRYTVLNLNSLGRIACRRGDYTRSRAFLEESLGIATHNGHPQIGSCLLALGDLASEEGDWMTAKSYYQEALSVHQAKGDRNKIASNLLALAECSFNLSCHDLAKAQLAEGLKIIRQTGGWIESPRGLDVAAMLELQRAETLPSGGEKGRERAARLLGASSRLRVQATAQDKRIEQLLIRVCSALHQKTFMDAWEQGRTMTAEQAIQLAIQAAEENDPSLRVVNRVLRSEHG